MCTVIYIPTKDGALFSSCRDEDPARAAAMAPQIIKGNTGWLLYPKDAAANGSWAGVNEKGHVVILLNGAFKNHERINNYKKSRGHIVIEILDSINPLHTWNLSDLHFVEPFTIVCWYQQQLYEWVWDGNAKHNTTLEPGKPFIWSSSTLYNEEVKQLRSSWFKEALKNNKLNTAEELLQTLNFHNDATNGFVMKRNETIQTLSISLIQHCADYFNFNYYDLRQQKITNVVLKQFSQLQAV